MVRIVGNRRQKRRKCFADAPNLEILLSIVLVLMGVAIILSAWIASTFLKNNTESIPTLVTTRRTTRTRPVATSETQSRHQALLVECVVTTPNNTNSSTAANGIIQITLHPDLAPVACRYFIDLVRANWYDDVFIFRVLKGFVAQWGAQFNGRQAPPAPTTVDANNTLSNLRGTLSFAGGRPKSKQVFINLNDNTRLDKEDSHPFARVSKQSMEKVVDRLYMGYKDGQGQIPALKSGTILEKFPFMSKISHCRVVASFTNNIQ